MKIRVILSSRTFYLAWALISALGLAIASYIDPYVFGFTAFAAAFVSGFLVLVSVVMGWRSLMWAIVCAIPTALAFMLLSTYNWA